MTTKRETLDEISEIAEILMELRDLCNNLSIKIVLGELFKRTQKISCGDDSFLADVFD